MTASVNLDRFDDIAVITVNNPPVNALSHAVRSGVYECLDASSADSAVRAVVLTCAGRTFFAGADITEFGKLMKSPDLRQLLAHMDNYDKLLVAAIHGTALGGGLETALCCHYRVAARSARLGLPESRLGLLPGAGGTQRLPRLVGAEAALTMMISGEPVTAPAALESGLADRLVEPDSLVHDAVAFARELLNDKAPMRKISALTTPPVAEEFFANYRQKIARKTRGFMAPERIVQCVEAAVNEPFDRGLAIERTHFDACMASTQSAALRHLFFAERAATRVAGVERGATVAPIESVGVVGAGTMGAGIALACLNARLPVKLVDSNASGLAAGVANVEKLLADQVDKGRISSADRDARLARLTPADSLADLADTDLIIEAVFESMAVKLDVFTELDAIAKSGAVLASNTSTLDLDQIAGATGRPQDVIGLHFFSPAHIMRLLEMVRGKHTAPALIARCMEFGKRIGKTNVVVGNCFGFVGNRMLYGYGRENQMLLLEGAAPEQIDKALTEFGMAMGPNAVGDLAGLDIGYKVRQERNDLPDDPRYYRVADMLAEMGRYGQKTGAGIYRYESGSRKPIPDPEVQSMIRNEAERLGIAQRTISDAEIVERCILALIVEGARVLEEGIASRSSDIDVVWTAGYGFPRYRGGPMFYADTLGTDHVREAVRKLGDKPGPSYWAMPPLLSELAESKKTFSAWSKT